MAIVNEWRRRITERVCCAGHHKEEEEETGNLDINEKNISSLEDWNLNVETGRTYYSESKKTLKLGRDNSNNSIPFLFLYLLT
jgi:hypothetical protein